MILSILYRGTLSSCNYGCPYCPFAKTIDSRETLARDAAELQQFTDFVAANKEIEFRIFFTPWGEGLIRKHYQQAMVTLSHQPNVSKVAIQTNLSCRLKWLKNGNREKIALWTTYHPGETTREAFLAQCRQLSNMKIAYSVGVVGFKDMIGEIKQLRAELPSGIYLWVNALKKQADYYTEGETAILREIDPHVTYNMTHHSSNGKACKTGNTVFSVDGEGNMYRCHFIKEKIGNIYQPTFLEQLYPRPCTNETCGCHIGYVHLEHLQLEKVYKGKELERIA